MYSLLTDRQIQLAYQLAALINKARGNKEALAAYFNVAYQNGLAPALRMRFCISGYPVGRCDEDAPIMRFEEKLRQFPIV